jgi:hypothetical protein
MGAALEYGTPLVALAAAVTDFSLNRNLGYVAPSEVMRALWEPFGLTDPNPDMEVVFSRLHDAALIDRALADAAAVRPSELHAMDTGLQSMYYQDLGYVDYAKLAFSLFGLKIESLYVLFFVLLGISTGAFILAFSENPFAMIAVIAVSFGFYVELNSSIFSSSMPTVYGFRYPSVLGILPTLHLSLLLLSKQRLSLGQLALATVQAALLIFSIKMRASAQWGLIVLLAIAACQFLTSLISCWEPQRDRRLAVLDAAQATLRWPILLLAGLMLVHAAYMRAVLHPVYETDDVLTGHPFWHVILINIAPFDPDLVARAGTVGTVTSNDDVGFHMARIWAKENHLFENPSSYGSPLTHTTTRIGLHEKIMRHVYLEYVARHPLRMAKLYLVEKPLLTARIYWTTLQNAFPASTLPIGAGASLVFALGLLFLPWQPDQPRTLAFVLILMALATMLGPIATFPSPPFYLADLIIVWLTASILALPLAAGFVFGPLARGRFAKKHEVLGANPGNASSDP